jgi:ribose transport system permease protein
MSASPGAAAPVEEDRQEEQAARARPSAVQRLGIQRFAILIVFAALVVAFGAAIPSTFLSIGNLSNILGSQAVLFILVMAVLLPTVMGDFVDLSLGSSLGLSAMTLAVLNVQHHTPVVLACLAGIGAALVVGLFNVFFVVYFDNDPFIVTLGTMTIVQGIIYIISGNNNVGIEGYSDRPVEVQADYR